MTIQELESYFNLTCKLRESIFMMARANHTENSPTVHKIIKTYDLLYKEIEHRLNSLYEGINEKKEVLNEEVVH